MKVSTSVARPADGGLQVLADDEVAFMVPAAYAMDAEGATAPLAMSLVGPDLTMTSDAAWLAEPERGFP